MKSAYALNVPTFPTLPLFAAFLLAAPLLIASEMDDRIEASAKKTYVFRTFLMGDEINITSRDGGVLLTGSVTEDSHRMLAQDTVQGLPGVKSVDNQIVTNTVHEGRSDAWLQMKVKNALAFHRNVKALGIKVDAKNGLLVLTGSVSSEAMKELTTEYALDVRGVKEVHNLMTVARDEKLLEEPSTSVTEIIDDASITAQVRMALLSHNSTSPVRTTVRTAEGVVHLGGTTNNQAEQDLVIKLVNDINGVVRILNQMTVAK